MPGRTAVEKLYSSKGSTLAEELLQLEDYSSRGSTSEECLLEARDYSNRRSYLDEVLPVEVIL